MFYLLTYLSAWCYVLLMDTGSLEKPQKSVALQLKTSQSKKSTDSPQTRDRSSPVSTPVAVEHQSLSSPSGSREERSHTSRTSSSHSSHRRERSRSRSRENRKKRSRSWSNDSRRRSHLTDQGRNKRETCSRSKDRSRRSSGKDHRSSCDDDSVRRVFVRQADCASLSSKTHQSDRSIVKVGADGTSVVIKKRRCQRKTKQCKTSKRKVC